MDLSAKYQVDASLAQLIIECESSLYKGAKHENKLPDGTVWSTDVGLFQINDYFHRAKAKSLGLDIDNEDDNLEYGFYLLSTYGTKPWEASRKCWDK